MQTVLDVQQEKSSREEKKGMLQGRVPEAVQDAPAPEMVLEM